MPENGRLRARGLSMEGMENEGQIPWEETPESALLGAVMRWNEPDDETALMLGVFDMAIEACGRGD